MADFKKLDALMESLPQGGIPSADLIVTHHGKEVYRRQVGYSEYYLSRKFKREMGISVSAYIKVVYRPEGEILTIDGKIKKHAQT